MAKKLDDFAKKYKESKEVYKRPSDDLPVEEKMNAKYFKEVTEYLFYLGATGQLYTSGILQGTSKFSILREYGRGEVPIEKYKDDIVGKDEHGGRRKTLINISWRPDLGYINTLSQMAGSYDKMDYDLKISAIDPSSDYERKERVANLKINTDNSLKQLAQSAGVEYIGDQEEGEPQFENTEDVDIFVKAGGLKLKSEISVQKAINKTKDYCSWRDLKAMLARDMRELGMSATKDYVDLADNTATLRYVDPDKLLIPFSKYTDFRDITMAGEIRMITIADLRNESELKEDKLCAIAKNYGFNGTLSEDNGVINRVSVREGMPYDHVIVYILDSAWLSSDLTYYTEKKIEKHGILEFKEKDHNYEIKQRDLNKGKTLNKYRRQYTYKCSWIIGSCEVYNYGKDYYQTREGEDGNKKAILPYHIVTTGEPSKLERIIADIDTINIITYKRRNAIANIPAPPGIIINKSALENVKFGGTIKSPIDLYQDLMEGGVLALDTENEMGDKVTSIHDIVGYIQTNLLEQFRIFSEQILESRRNIQLATGYNDVIDGSADNERRLKVEGEAKLEAANNAMQTEYSAMRTLIQNTYKNVIYRWQEITRFKNIKSDSTPLSQEDFDVIKSTSDISRNKFDLRVTLSASESERRMMMQELLNLKSQKAQTGAGGISEADYIMLYRVIMEDNNIALAQVLLAQAKKEQENKDMQKSMALQQQNAQVQMQSAQRAEEERRKTLFTETALKMLENQQISANKIQEIVAKADLEDGKAESETVRNILNQLNNPQANQILLAQVQEKINNWGGNKPQQQ